MHIHGYGAQGSGDMTAREMEEQLLTRCAVVGHGGTEMATDQREANGFKLAAMLMQSRFPREAGCLMRASENYFQQHPSDRMPAASSVQNGWVSSLPRFRVMLSVKLLQQG